MTPKPMTPAQLEALDTLADWRVLINRLCSRFTAPSFGEAAAFVSRVADAADEADHHPDIDLRYPGVVQIALTTHASHGLTELDASLAARISELAADAGLRADPGPILSIEIGIDALDIDAVRPFWQAVLGLRPGRGSGGGELHDLVDPRRFVPAVWFQQMDAPRPQRNRIHLDIFVPSDVAASRLDAALAAGGRLVTDRFAPSFWVLADPEGNEACICTWQDRA